MMFRTIALILLAAPAVADEPVCYNREALIRKLDEGFSERNLVTGLETRGAIVEIYVSEAGTWTMIVVPDQSGPLLGCIIASGDNFKMIASGIPS